MLSNIIIEKDVMVPMRDSVRLSTDIYRPDDDKKHPVMVLKSLYDKDDFWIIHELICSPLVAVNRGYVVVIQDDRGRFKSEGTWGLDVDAPDAYDTVEWAAAQPWSDGNVGLYGNCGLGYAPWFGAIEQPPHLKAIFSYVSTANFYEGWTYTSGGAFHLGFNLPWVGFIGIDTFLHANLPPEELKQKLATLAQVSNLGNTPEETATHLPLHLPLIDLPAATDLSYWREWLSHPTYDDYWAKCNALAHAGQITVPVLHATGWYDICAKGHVKMYEAMMAACSEHVREQSRFLVGPWDHSAYYNHRENYSGERRYPVATGPNFLGPMILAWFDRWLKGEDIKGRGEVPDFLAGTNTVRYYQLGENVWKEDVAWPPKSTTVAYYVHSNGRANSRMGDGWLSTEVPSSEPVDSFVYDPLDPVLSVGGQTMMMTSGLWNQSENEKRQDMLVFTSPRLAEPLVIAGPVTVTLFASTTAPDTDFTAKLVDVEPDGYCANVTEGIIRARYRNGTDHEDFITPGEVTQFEIELYDTAHTFAANHCIRLEIASSNFPLFDRNLNSTVTPALATEKDAQKAVQQVFHNGQFTSCLNLPVVGA